MNVPFLYKGSSKILELHFLEKQLEKKGYYFKALKEMEEATNGEPNEEFLKIKKGLLQSDELLQVLLLICF